MNEHRDRPIRAGLLVFAAAAAGFSAPVAAAPLPPIKLAAAVLDTGAGVNLTPAELSKLLFTNPDSLRAWFLEASFGAQDLTGGVAPMILRAPGVTCMTPSMATSLRAQVDQALGG